MYMVKGVELNAALRFLLENKGQSMQIRGWLYLGFLIIAISPYLLSQSSDPQAVALASQSVTATLGGVDPVL